MMASSDDSTIAASHLSASVVTAGFEELVGVLSGSMGLGVLSFIDPIGSIAPILVLVCETAACRPKNWLVHSCFPTVVPTTFRRWTGAKKPLLRASDFSKADKVSQPAD